MPENVRQPANQLLARLPPKEYQRLLRRLEPVRLDFKQVIYEARSIMDHAYFPSSGVLSALTVMADGSAIEVANIGNEGLAGATLMNRVTVSANKVIVQVAGDGLRIDADALKEETRQDCSLRRLLDIYEAALMTQVSYAVACNGLHRINQRCCRWLLMTADRCPSASGEIPLTHEFLAIMLGVRRASVTEVLQPLQEAGLIETGRGRIRIIDRQGLEAAACECYKETKDEYERLFSEPND